MLSWQRMLRIASSIGLSLASRVIPRSNTLWVVGGSKGLKYGDNAMYFFKYCSRHSGKRVVWLAWSPDVVAEVRTDGYEGHRIDSLKGLWLGLRAKWHVFDVAPEDTGLTSRGAHLLNLWHGIPLKDIRFLKRRPLGTGRFRRLGRRILADKHRAEKTYFVHPDEAHIQHILDSFDLFPQNVIYANLPRNIVFEHSEGPRKWCKPRDLPAIDHLQELTHNGARIIGYFPTWRGGQGDMFLGTLDPAELARVNAFLKRKNCYLLTKWHDCVYSTYKHSGASVAAEHLIDRLREQSNFIVLGFDADLNSHLPLCDLLITDYSSVFFDYLLTDQPILFFPYDLDAYRSRWGFFYDYEAFVPGTLVKNIDEMFSALKIWNEDPQSHRSEFAQRRSEYRSIFFAHSGNPALIMERMNAAVRPRSILKRGSEQ